MVKAFSMQMYTHFHLQRVLGQIFVDFPNNSMHNRPHIQMGREA